MKYEAMELIIARYSERRYAERDAELAARLAVPKSTEDMLLAFRVLEGLNVKEREVALVAG